MIYDYSGNEVNAAFDNEGNGAAIAYDKDGGVVFPNTPPTPPTPDPSIYDSYSISSLGNIVNNPGRPRQGFAIIKDSQQQNILFQFTGGTGNVFSTYYFDTKAAIEKNMSINSGHGNSAMFSNTKYDPSDEFPLIYISDWIWDASATKTYVYINRVTTSTAQLIKTLSFPVSQCGYGANFCFDFANNIAYGVGYTIRDYDDDHNGTNYMIVSKWDLSNLTDNGDNTYTPAFLSSLNRNFIKVTQGIIFHDGMIWVSYGGSSDTGKIIAINPTNGDQLYYIDNTYSGEMEGCCFISSTELVYGLNNWYNYKVTFTGQSN